ncbi:MAG: PQQ-binding-like beta-propeller repeat protein [Gemmatimonadetes bacterium]|nr:PQQ-binding-like beta-propeller repeat protein [Gemmatimonadota bacterium]
MRTFVLTSFLLLACFAAGFFIAVTERPPYGTLFRAYDAFRRNPAVDAVYDRLRGVPSTPPPVAPKADKHENHHWNLMAERTGDETDAEIEAARQAVEGLAYLQSYEKATGKKNVTVHDPARSQPGLNLFTNAVAPAAHLMDQAGNRLHTWTIAFEEAFSESGAIRGPGYRYWFYSRLFPNGDLIAVYPRHGIVRLDKDSRLLWAVSGDYHHTFDYDSGHGTIIGLRRGDLRPASWSAADSTWHERLVTLDAATGDVLREVSLIDAIEQSEYAALLQHASGPNPDRLHPNTVQILDGRFERIHPAFKKGNILTSFRNLDTIGVVDPGSGLLVWALTGLFDHQHRPNFLDDGTLLVFNNNPVRGQSEIAVLDPLTQERVWSYEAEGFYTRICGVAWPLANGNVLASESQAGRAFEVTPDGEIVWEYYTPERRGENGEMIPTLFEIYRYPTDYADAWLVRKDS